MEYDKPGPLRCEEINVFPSQWYIKQSSKI